jgi:hypothetical protein
VYRRGKGLIVILIHPKLLVRFKHTDKREVEGLENICCVRGKCGNSDVIFTHRVAVFQGSCHDLTARVIC